MRMKRSRRGNAAKRKNIEAEELEKWVPSTRLGNLVKEGKITSLEEVLYSNLPLKEWQIVEIFSPGMDEEVLDINMVQRVTDSGRRTRYNVVVGVGNRSGLVGVGRANHNEVGSAIRKAVKQAKLNVMEVPMGCGSWECGCNAKHSIPIAKKGKCGSVEITLYPAPKGVGIAASEIPKKILSLAGIQDIWVQTRGKTRTSINLAGATYDALKRLIATRGL